jgi:hypothetical protein
VNQKTLLSLSVALMGLTSVATADITGASWYSLDYNNLNCTTAWDPNSSTLSMHADQYGSGVMSGNFSTDSASDPRATKTYYISNETGSNWIGYNVNVFMDRAFSISNIVVSLPAGWSILSVTQPTNNAPVNYFSPLEYEGHIVLQAGSQLPDGGELDFQYDVGFAGSTAYRFADELSPIVAVPEPGILGLATLGGLFVAGRSFRRRTSAS